MRKYLLVPVPAALLVVLLAAEPGYAGQVEVVSHQKISRTQGNYMGPMRVDGRFGGALAFIADFGNSGQSVLVAGEANGDISDTGDGAVSILFLDMDGSGRVANCPPSQKIPNPPNQMNKLPTSYGLAVETIGDLDKDGVPDIAVGDHRDDADLCPSRGIGAVWIAFMNPDGTVKGSQVRIANGFGLPADTLAVGGDFGIALADLGDLRGDGTRALAVGANKHAESGGPDTGAVWILFLDCQGGVVDTQLIADGRGNFPSGQLQSGDAFGSGLDALGDLDGDNVCDLAVGTTLDDDGGMDRGAVWILFLNSDGTVKQTQKISDTAGSFSGTFHDQERFGNAVASIGDIDRDGNTDLAVGAVQDADGGPNRGAVWILCLNSDGTVKSHSKISSTQGRFAGPLNDIDSFGSSVEHVAELDRDGLTALAVGAIGDDDGGTDLGAIWICFLGPPCTAGNVQDCLGNTMDVLFVNGTSGGSNRTVTVDPGMDITVTLDSSDPMGCPISGTYVLWVWPGLPQSPADLVVGDRIGCLVNPTPLQLGSPQPIRCLRGQGVPNAVCRNVQEVNAPALAPWSVTKRGGFINPITLTLQGVVRDPRATNPVGFSITNAVTLVIP